MSTSTENKVKHTAGPWEDAGAAIYKDGVKLAQFCGDEETAGVWEELRPDGRWISFEEAKANQRLALAAPDLLAVAKMIERIPMSVPRHIVQAARDAILKAEGSI